ncbi:ChaN family lipoprotein [Pyxidicoccus caerfyrddinensis]|uniref:ChaN family lipoprotein n=1 Tax=Pyxidicoccus caerfyrddinensis TaxID=2709663 RepID=UPI0013D99107|nr:ChaN family lipoprotein [Pyxidicoccus caerfyrddinensis]
MATVTLRHLLVATALLGGCKTAQPAVQTPDTGTTNTAQADCGPAIPGMEALLKPAAFIVLGEMHGTQEAPAFTTRLACHAAAAGQPVRVGLELPVEEQPRIDAFLASEDGALQPLTAGGFWTQKNQDGRSSKAMLQALVRLRELKRAGLPVDVRAFDAGGGDRDATMAAKLLQERALAPRDTFIVLTGNLHARRDKGAPWDPNLRFMSNHLLEAEPGLVTLDMAYLGGSMWACIGRSEDACKVQPLKKARYEEHAATPRIVVQKGATDEGYDGVYGVGTATASPPAVHAATALPTP